MSETQKSITEEVASRLASAVGEIREGVIAQMAAKTLTSRTDSVLNTIAQLDKLSKDRTAILKKPANVAYNENGEKVSETYSKEQIDGVQKATDRSAKLNRLLDDAMRENTNDAWAKLNDLLNKG
ncbi:MAG: hypothetical protein AB7U75_14595 [Hyphomicrobiaceae bacterium]